MASRGTFGLPYETRSLCERMHLVVTDATGRVVHDSPYRADCPARRILDRIGDRWTVLVVGILAEGEARFSELGRRIEGVSKKMLTQTLRGLERDGLVRRTVYPEVPVRVEYALTDAGRTLCEPLRALQEWSIAHLGDVATSQEAYDRAD
jgi:DNA-binding HxlR family transcriptional regulator